MEIQALTIEYRENPIGITELNPRFSWRYDSKSGEQQQSYRILVSMEGRDYPTVWDSGEVNSAETINIVYNGLELESSRVYHVHLLIKTTSGHIVEKKACFETGLLNENDWYGLWYGSAAFGNGGTLWIRGVFSLQEKEIKRARIYLAAIDYHTLYINGEKVDDRLLAPSFTDYTKRITYVTYDVTKFLNSGKNCVGIEVAQGFTGRKTAMMQMFVEYADGDVSFRGATGIGEWAIKITQNLRSSIYGGERYDAFLGEDEGWTLANFDATEEKGWGWPIPYVEGGERVSETLSPIKVLQWFKPISQNIVSKNCIVYDFGKNRNGWCKIRVCGDKGDKVIIKYAEAIDENGMVDRRNLRAAKCIDEYVLSGNGEEAFAPKYSWRGFRYAEVMVVGNATLLDIEAAHIANSIEKVGEFYCSDESLNRLHEMAVQTEANNQVSILTDCPQRSERLGWLNDLTPRIYQNVNNYDMAVFFEKISKDILDTQLPSGEIADTAPFMGGGRPADPVCVSYLLLGWFSYRYYGNRKLIVEHYESYAKWVSFLVGNFNKYILENTIGIGDWVYTDLEQKTDRGYVSIAYIIWHLQLMVEFSKILGKEKQLEEYTELKEQFTKFIIEKYYDAVTCNFAAGTQAANAMALSIGFAPINDREKILNNLIENIISKSKHSTSGNQGYRHLFSVLGDAEYVDLLVDILKNPEYPGWGYMLSNAATTVWEGWEKETTSERNSFNHPMFASYDLLFYQYIAGLRIDNNAYACNFITLHPTFVEGLDFVKCSLKTVRGGLQISWERKNGVIYYNLVVPQGITARIELGEKVFLDGNPIQYGKIVQAGNYSFVIYV